MDKKSLKRSAREKLVALLEEGLLDKEDQEITETLIRSLEETSYSIKEYSVEVTKYDLKVNDLEDIFESPLGFLSYKKRQCDPNKELGVFDSIEEGEKGLSDLKKKIKGVSKEEVTDSKLEAFKDSVFYHSADKIFIYSLETDSGDRWEEFLIFSGCQE